MIPHPSRAGRKVLFALVVIGALVFIVQAPAKAAVVATSAVNGLVFVVQSVATFAENLG
ncbi:hypothetical protein OIE66_30760 [Nonomuraea sp. NBC_01738]|uniref:hypothetical protein n=1 Tax=Nonomuraea sp. NBC_01738 TaxID=2976003 RepID=UPI002E1320C2|nr:hypothetical protein OIE66_30760 [Nonomuraea sp. NBC_01738]